MSWQINHTPGPWSIGYNGYNASMIYGPGERGVAVCSVFLPLHRKLDEIDPQKFRTELADARLISCAPEMLATLIAVLNSDAAMREEDEGNESSTLKAIREIVSKATST